MYKDEEVIEIVRKINAELYDAGSDEPFGSLVYSTNYYSDLIKLGDVVIWDGETQPCKEGESIEQAVRRKLSEFCDFWKEAKSRITLPTIDLRMVSKQVKTKTIQLSWAELNRNILTNAVLYLAQSGKFLDVTELLAALYIADKKQLITYGDTITDCVYFASRVGPIPNMHGFWPDVNDRTKPNLDYLSSAAIECLDYAINKYESSRTWPKAKLDLAWQKGRNNPRKYYEIDLLDMAEGASEDMLQYIQIVRENKNATWPVSPSLPQK